MENVLIVLGIVNVLLILRLIYGRHSNQPDPAAAGLIKQDLTNLSLGIEKLKDNMQKQMSDNLVQNTEQMNRQYQASSKIIKDVTEKLTELEKTNKQVGDIAGDLKTLQNVLQNPKQRGVLGEYYLQTVLENVLPPDRFALQHKFKNGETVDAVIFLDKGKILPIDSKFSLENYNRLIDEKDTAKRELIVATFKADLKNRIDETAKYIRPSENTMDFAFMFIPSEAIYYDLLINKVGATTTSARDLLEYAFMDKKVIIVSPTSFMAYLQTVLQGLRSLQIEDQAKDIQKRVGELGRHLGTHDEFMQKLGGSLGTTVGHYNRAHQELGKIDKDVTRIAGASPGIEPLLLDRPSDDQE